MVTLVIIAIAVGAFLPAISQGSNAIDTGGSLAKHLELFGPDVANGQWWRLFTSGFVHYGLMHLLFNMAILYQIGSQLEAIVGRFRFGLLYAIGLAGGALGALVLDPLALTGGASGAVFALMSASVLIYRRRGIDLRQSGLPTLLGVNLLITVLVPGISIGGHLGGLLAGAVAGSILARTLAPSGSGADGRLDERVATAALIIVALWVTLAGIFVAANPL